MQLHGNCREIFNRDAVSPPIYPKCGNNTSESPRCYNECDANAVMQRNIAYLEPQGDAYSARIGIVLEPEMVRWANERAERERAVLNDKLDESPVSTAKAARKQDEENAKVYAELDRLDDRVLKESMIWFDRIEERKYAPQWDNELEELMMQMTP